MSQSHDFASVSNAAALAGGKLLMDMWHKVEGKEKGPRDLVSEADLASQQAIRHILLDAFPTHNFIGEEDTAAAQAAAITTTAEYTWVVDPLDGTTNYLHKLPTFSVSIALMHKGEILCGTVYDPVAKECFHAIRGGGAWVNNTPIRTSGCQHAHQALVAASFSPFVKRDSREVTRFVEALVSCQAVRRLGSAALNLSYVAAGRLDAYWATAVKLWDVAAGMLLVQEAGGIVAPLGNPTINLLKPEFVATATPQLMPELLEILER
jgi:myo-inositol-1(or 4)-monophosphatase